jgi:hypothetical protein
MHIRHLRSFCTILVDANRKRVVAPFLFVTTRWRSGVSVSCSQHVPSVREARQGLGPAVGNGVRGLSHVLGVPFFQRRL